MTVIKTCERCKALEISAGEARCRLGFSVMQLEVIGSTIKVGKIGPSGQDGVCPKPTTNADFVWWSKQSAPVATPGQRHGANGERRVDFETVAVLRLRGEA